MLSQCDTRINTLKVNNLTLLIFRQQIPPRLGKRCFSFLTHLHGMINHLQDNKNNIDIMSLKLTHVKVLIGI